MNDRQETFHLEMPYTVFDAAETEMEKFLADEMAQDIAPSLCEVFMILLAADQRVKKMAYPVPLPLHGRSA